MFAGEFGLYRGPVVKQPVHDVIQFVLVNITEAVGGGGRIEATGLGQSGAGIEDPRDDHGDDEVVPARPAAVDQGVETELAQGSGDGGDMAVRQRPGTLEPVGGQRPGAGSLLRGMADSGDGMRRQMGDGGGGALFDLAAAVEGFAHQDGGR